MESKDRIPQNFDVLDLSRAMNSFKREQIRKILELPDHQSFSIVRWYSPAEVKPIEATYVMAKLYERGSALSVSARPMNTGDFGSSIH